MGLKDLFSFGSGSFSSSKVVGVDIGSSSIKVVELEDRDGVITLTTYGELQLGPYKEKEIGQNVSLSIAEEQQALIDILRESAVTAREAVFAMPLSSSFVTTATLDVAENSDLGALVRIEARKVIPASLSEVSLDWAEIATSKKEKEAKQAVLIAAIQNSALDKFKTLMKFAGMNNPLTEIECFSTIRSLYEKSEPVVAIIDIGSTSTKLHIASEGSLVRMHRVRAGGTIVTQKFAELLGCSFEEAESKKQNLKSQDKEHADLLKTNHLVYARPFREFRQVIDDYEEKMSVKLNTVHVSGGGALGAGVKEELEKALDRRVNLADPFRKVAYPAFMEDTLEYIGPSFTVALGAAIRLFE